jgi:Protein of unknown function (DUF3035)
MSLHRREHGVGRGFLTWVFVALCGGTLALTGCSGIKQAMGLDPPMPNEFAVESNPPLTIPPEFDLRPPQPGARGPQDESMAKQAQQVINEAGPGAPGEQQSPFRLQRAPNDLGSLGPQAPNPNSMVSTSSLSSKLLDYSGAGNAGATVEKRETEPLKGVY